MLKRSKVVFTVLHIITWIIFIGLSIDAGALIVNFIFSLVKPEMVINLYQKLDLTQMYDQSRLVYFGIYGFILAISVLKASLFYTVIMLLSKLDLSKPFSIYVASQIKKISYYTLSIGLISYIASEIAPRLTHYGIETSSLNHFWADSQAYIFMAAVVYVIASIFSRGVEIQNENDLTV